MNISSEPLEAPPQLLTQDDSPPELNGGLIMRSVLDTLVLPGDMSPSASAQFVTCVVDQADKTQICFQSRLVRC